MRSIILLAVLALAAPFARSAEPTSQQAVMRAFTAAASAKEKLRQVPTEYASLVLLSIFQADAESPLLIPRPWPDTLEILQKRETYWASQLDAILVAKRRCDSESQTGLIVIPSLTEHARDCGRLMSARSIVEAILEDVGKDKVYARLMLNDAGTAADAKALLERKRGVAERVWAFSLGADPDKPKRS